LNTPGNRSICLTLTRSRIARPVRPETKMSVQI
jgi:hypothetical protein